MKTFALGLLIATALQVSLLHSASAAQCKVQLQDIGPIIGQGATRDLAFEDAATQCYEKRIDRLQGRRTPSASNPSAVDDETKLTLIDLCANVTCR